MKRIPKKIWQIGKNSFSEHSNEVKGLVNSWKIKNPDWEYNYIVEGESYDWVEKNFDKEWAEIYKNYPLGVMRADVLRYMLMYKEGGVYADLDTRCITPIEEWFNVDYNVYLTKHSPANFQQWLLISNKNQTVFEEVLKLAKHRSKQGINLPKCFVHHITGPNLWTDAILKFIGIDDEFITPRNHSLIEQRCHECDIYFKGAREDIVKFRKKDVVHYFSSVKIEPLYDSWVQEKTKL